MSAFVIPAKLPGQEKFCVSGGFSTAELLNGGFRYENKQSQFGLSIRTIPAYSYKSLALTGSFYYHFGNSSKFAELPSWRASVVRDDRILLPCRIWNVLLQIADVPCVMSDIRITFDPVCP